MPSRKPSHFRRRIAQRLSRFQAITAYALIEGKLSELNIFPEQVPDKPVAMSTPVTQPSRTILTNGRTQFIVFRRDLATNAPERVDVRVVAQVRCSLTFDSKGKPTFAGS